MRSLFLAAAATALAFPVAPAVAQHHHDHGRHGRHHHDNGRHRGWSHRPPRAEWRHYDWNHHAPGYSRYYADRYYVGRGYRPIRVTRHTRIYRGYDGRYYCRRSDGTTGLIVGAALGGLLGNTLADGRSALLATVLGGAAGGLIGREIDRGHVTCR